MDDLTTQVWRLTGVTGSDPGLMRFEDGTVTLHLADDDDELTRAFSVPVTEIGDVNWPRLPLSGGCTFVVEGKKYRLSFRKPQNTRPLAASAGAAVGAMSIIGGRRAGKAWKSVLSNRSRRLSSPRRPLAPRGFAFGGTWRAATRRSVSQHRTATAPGSCRCR